VSKDIDFYTFGKELYDIALKNFIDVKGIKDVEIPVKDSDGVCLMTFKASQPKYFMEFIGDDFVTYYKNSDGSFIKR